jgi:beta-lactamase regulating signal transducer with metallopeptidase domain
VISPISTVGFLLAGGPIAVVAKATIVLAGTVLVAMTLRGASAAFRHLIWLLGLTACAALAVFSPAAPTIDVGVASDAPPMLDRASTGMLARPRPSVITIIGTNGTPVSRVMSEAPVPPVKSIVIRPPRDVRSVAARLAGSLERFAMPFTAPLLLGIWVVGCAVIVVRSVVGHRRIDRIIERSTPLRSAAWNGSLASAARELGLTRDVDLLMSEDLSAPITSGFTVPVVIMPADCASWDDERRRIVLVHELAHVARLDYVAQLVATLACAIFWFHPAVWFAATRLRAEAEHAADDRVIAAGTLGLTYATHLLELARANYGPQSAPSLAVGMIRSSRLEGRFRAMLDSTRSRAGVSPRVQAAAATLMLCAMIPLAGLRTVARAAQVPATAVTPVVPLTRMPATAVMAIPSAPATTPIAAATTAIATIATVATPATAATSPAVVSIVSPVVAESTFEKSIAASNMDRLSIDLPSGGAIVLHGWDEPRIRLVASLGGRDWRDTRVELTTVSRGARLRSDLVNHDGSQSTSHQFELWVPRRINVDVSSAGGSVSINDLSGELTGHTGGGDITIERSSGRASMSTGGGSVMVTNSDLSGAITTGGGEVSISNVTGGLRGESGSGSVVTSDGVATTIGGIAGGFGGVRGMSGTTTTTVDGATIRGGVVGGISGGFGGGIATGVGRSTTVTTNTTGGFGGTITTNYPDGFATSSGRGEGRGFGYGGVSISKAGGQILLDEAPNGGVVHTGGGQIVVRSSGGALAASTGGGDVTLERVSGDASVSTGAGEVHITVVNTVGAAHSIEVFSGKGRVVLELPANLDARIELETAYTENFGSRTSIESDFPLDGSETREWDDRFGSPRKFVRATGTLGSGTGLIRVRTVNGDVVVRRR